MGMTLADAQTTTLRVLSAFVGIFSNPTSNFSAISMLSAFAVAAVFLMAKRGRSTRFAVLARALLPRHWWQSRSVRADVGFFLLNTFVTGLLIGWALLSAGTVESAVGGVLDRVSGSWEPVSLPRWGLWLIFTFGAYFSYELGYYVDHYLKHRVPFLWQFHRVHHSAEVLTPITNARMHPVDSAIFANIVALSLGAGSALLHHAFTTTGAPVSFFGNNAVMLVALFLILHLQHSHVWMPFTGWLGKVVLSPAHHQLHHSSDPRHFNRNLGATLAIFDWMAGTLLVPSRERTRLTFGAGPFAYDPHSPSGSLVMPFVEAAREVLPQAAAAPTAEPVTR